MVMARGEDADAILRVLTPENRRLLGLIYRHNPDSVRTLCSLAGKAQPNVSRALAVLERAGVIRMVGARPKRPELMVQSVTIDLTE
ncbi:MAG: MarR family transcriptional regulator [Alphaproteobacteria bacterium]|nr:MarR family transcriptional regulator [Alphaproteobacteria bacterium]